jgi:nickel transport protein
LIIAIAQPNSLAKQIAPGQCTFVRLNRVIPVFESQKMIKSFIRIGVVLGLLSSHMFLSPSLPSRVLGSSLFGTSPAIALTEEEILTKLKGVPVFTVTDPNGAPLVATVPQDGSEASSVAGVFISRQDAVNFVNNLKQNNPELASAVQVTIVSLGEVYQMSQQARSNPDELQFAYVPGQQQVNEAKALLNQDNFQGVPLFIARQNTQEGGYLTIQQGENQIVPTFFNKEDLQGLLENFQAQQPDLIQSIEIEVVSLEGLLEALRTDNDENQFFDRIQLIPPRETIEFINQQQSGN